MLRPNFQWTSETMPVKQSMNMMITIFLGFAMPILAAVGCWLTRNLFSADVYLGLATAVLVLLCLVLSRWLDTKGAAKFESL